MAGPANGRQAITPTRRSRLLRCIVFTILAIIVLVGVVALIIFLTVRPKKLAYTVEAGNVHGFDLHYNRLNATFDFFLHAHNPNSKVSFYYDTVSVSVSYDDQTIAFETIQPFFQSHHNVTRLELKPIARSVALQAPVAKDLRLEKSTGEIKLVVRVKVRLRMKVGTWKSSPYTIRVICPPLDFHLEKPKSFKRKKCNVDV